MRAPVKKAARLETVSGRLATIEPRADPMG
jgi:hypothetical protein